MLRIFHSLRQYFFHAGKLRQYLGYAIGEIILVVIGILIALQINNWNEKRKQEQRFLVTLEQLYTSIKEDVDLVQSFAMFQQEQIDWIDQLLTEPERFRPEQLPFILYYLDTHPRSFSSETDYYLSALEFNPNNSKQNELAKQIATYINSQVWDYEKDEQWQQIAVGPILEEANIPRYPMSFSYSALGHFGQVDTSFYTRENILAIRALLNSRAFRSTLRSMQLMKQSYNIASFANQQEDGRSILNAIRNYYPGIRLRYDDVGIIGSALPTGYTTSIPMQLTNPQKGIWEMDIELGDGTVKFRTRNSWNQNWGGQGFPSGNTIMYGYDVPVKPGKYHIVLNLSEDTYNFYEKN